MSSAPAAAGQDSPAMLAMLAIDEAQQAALLSELEVLLSSVTDRAARAPFVNLVAGVAEGSVGPEETATLEKLLEMSLQTGRARRVHGPEAEQALLRLFHKTPRGAAAKRTTEAVNQALRGLGGQTLEEILFTVQGPGVFKIGLRTDQCRLALEVDRHGVTVESLEV